jgi:hypothetical protein
LSETNYPANIVLESYSRYRSNPLPACIQNTSMQTSRILLVLSIPLLASTASLFTLSSAIAEPASPKFYCGKLDNVPTTMAKTRRGPVPIIRWVFAGFGENYSPENRCQLVSAKFQAYYEDDSINYLRAAYLNKQPVICAAKRRGDPACAVLFTLKPGSDPNRTLRQLLNIRDRTSNVILQESYVPTAPTEVDLNDFLDKAPVAAGAIGESEPTKPAPVESQPAPQPAPSEPSTPLNDKYIW